METPQQVLSRLGISTTSYIRAALQIGDWEIKSIEFYVTEISNLLGEKVDMIFVNPKVAHLYFGYYVQETVRVLAVGAIPDMEKIWTRSCDLARKFMHDFPFSTTERIVSDECNKLPWRTLAERFFKQNYDQMSKKELIVQMASSAGVSPASAQTFFAEMATKYDWVEKTPLHKQKISIEDIDACYRDNKHLTKSNIIEKFSILGLSPASASSHFYRCKKIHGSCADIPQSDALSKKAVVFEALERIQSEDLLNRKEICDKLSVNLGVPKSSIQTYYYQFLKMKNISANK